jgi:hypothetical protein
MMLLQACRDGWMMVAATRRLRSDDRRVIGRQSNEAMRRLLWLSRCCRRLAGRGGDRACNGGTGGDIGGGDGGGGACCGHLLVHTGRACRLCARVKERGERERGENGGDT